MDDTQVLDCTQDLSTDPDDDEEEEKAHSLVAWLEVSGSRYEIFNGKNIIGRDPDTCKIVIPSKVLSKEHAVVEVRAGTHTLADMASRNKTQIGKMVLRPHVQYALQGGEKIKFGNLVSTYIIKPQVCDDSGSETGSESMLPMMAEEDDEEIPSSPILSSRQDHQDPQEDEEVPVKNGIVVPSVSAQNSSITEAKDSPSSAFPSIASDSFFQLSDADSSVISATQSPARRTLTSLSLQATCVSPQDDYNSDASTDVEDSVSEEPCHAKPHCETPTSFSCTPIPETPPQPSPHSGLVKTPESPSSPSTSIQETPADRAPPTPKREVTAAHSSEKANTCETPSSLSPSPTVAETPAETVKDDMAGKKHDNDDFVFKKPLPASTLKTRQSPAEPSPKSSVVSKVKEAVPVHKKLFATTDSRPSEPVAPTQVLLSDMPSDADQNAPTSDVDLDAPTQVFTNDTSVDLDAPTQVFTHDTSVDLDAPTQVFTHDTSVDLDAPTQVFTSEAPSDVDLDAPTQVFTNEEPSDVDLDAPTQVFTSDVPSAVDLDAPTQVFTSDVPSGVDLDAPTQVFTNEAASDVDPDAPTQVFTNEKPSDVDPDVPTQVFNNETASDVDPDSPTQVFNNEKASDVDPDAPTQVFNNEATSDIDPDAPTQVFNDDTVGGVDPDAPTQVFNDKAVGGVEPSVSASNVGYPPGDDPPSSPTMLSDTDEDNIPTQLYSDLSTSTPRPSRSIIEAWGHVESIASQSTKAASLASQSSNTASLPDLWEKKTEDNDAASDTSDSLFNEEDEIGRLDDSTKKADVYGETGNDHKLKDESFHSDESTDLEEIVSSHENDGKASPIQSYQSKDPVKEGQVKPHLKTPRKEVGRAPALQSESESEENTCSQSLRLFDLPSDAEFREQMAASQLSTVSSNQESSEEILEVKEHKGAKGGENQVTELTASAKVTSQSSKESSEDILAVAPDTERAEGGDCEVLKQTPGGHTSQGSKEGIALVHPGTPHTEEAKHNKGKSEDESGENISNTVPKLPTEGDKAPVEDQRAVAYPTRKTSAKLCSLESNTSQNRSTRAKSRSIAAASVPIPSASSSTPSTVHTSTDVPITMTTTPDSSTTSTHAQTSHQNIVPSPNTRRQGRRAKSARVTNSSSTSITDSAVVSTSTRRSVKRSIIEDKVDSPASPQSIEPGAEARRQGRRKGVKETHSASTSAADSVIAPASTRRYSKRGTNEDTADLATTTNNNNNKYCTTEAITSVAVSSVTTTTTVTPAMPLGTAATSVTSIPDSTTSSPTPARRTRRGTQPQRVASQANVIVKDAEAMSVSADRAVCQPSTSADTDTSSIPATTRRRRGRLSTNPPVTKIKVEVPDDEPAQMATLTRIKEEKEEIDTLACDQFPIKVEPEDSLSGEESKQPKRTRRKPERFSPDRDTKLPGKNLRSKKSLTTTEHTGRTLRGNTGREERSSLQGGRKAPGRQKNFEQVQTVSDSGGKEEIVNPEDLPLKMRLKEEPKSSEDERSESLDPHCSALPERDPPKKNRQPRASTSRSARQAPSRATKKIKIEVASEEESDDCIAEISESNTRQTRVKKGRASCIERSSNNTAEKRTKRRNSDTSDTSSLASNNSFSSRATRSNKDVELWSPSKRQRQASSKPRVLFTGYNDPADHKIVADLGGRVVETPLDCTVLVTTKLKRTCKLLSAIGRGRLIVSPNWLTMSKAAGNFVDPWQFLLKDSDAEEKYGFCLEATIKSASNFLLFEGLSLHATPSVQPPPCQMRDIIECAGGDYLHTAPKKYEPQIRILSCPEDKKLWQPFKSLGIPILGVEFILTGLLRHELLLDEFVLG